MALSWWIGVLERAQWFKAFHGLSDHLYVLTGREPQTGRDRQTGAKSIAESDDCRAQLRWVSRLDWAYSRQQ